MPVLLLFKYSRTEWWAVQDGLRHGSAPVVYTLSRFSTIAQWTSQPPYCCWCTCEQIFWTNIYLNLIPCSPKTIIWCALTMSLALMPSGEAIAENLHKFWSEKCFLRKSCLQCFLRHLSSSLAFAGGTALIDRGSKCCLHSIIMGVYLKLKYEVLQIYKYLKKSVSLYFKHIVFVESGPCHALAACWQSPAYDIMRCDTSTSHSIIDTVHMWASHQN